MQRHLASVWLTIFTLGAAAVTAGRLNGADAAAPSVVPAVPNSAPGASPGLSPGTAGVEFVNGSTSSIVVERNGKRYVVDLVAHTVREADSPVAAHTASSGASANFAAVEVQGATVFKEHCAACHGPDGKGKAAIGTPDLTDPKIQTGLTDAQIIETIENGKKGTPMPAWKNELSEAEIKVVAAHVRSFAGGAAGQAAAAQETQQEANIYKPGDDVLMSLPTGRRLARHALDVNFSHRFAFDPAFEGHARGAALGGLDGFALPSFGFRYGVTEKFSVGIFRSPTFIGRPIQLMAAYNFLDERDGHPINAAVRFSVQGLDNFDREFTESLEGDFSRSITRRAQLYFVPAVSFNDRALFSPSDYPTKFIIPEPGYNAVSLGSGISVDVRPTVALMAEVIPTVVNGEQLGMHRPAFSIGIQKKIWRHAFTLGLTNSPGVTVSQRAGTLASFLGNPRADEPKGVVLGFNITRQIY